MTTLEYMSRQVVNNKLNFDRQFSRGAPEDDLANIWEKIKHYETAVAALRKVGDAEDESF